MTHEMYVNKIEIGETVWLPVAPLPGFESGWKPFSVPKSAQQSVHLTAFGVGMLAAIAIYFVGLIALLRKYGGR